MKFLPQSIQNARLSVKSSESGPPTPSPASKRVLLPPFWSKRAETMEEPGEHCTVVFALIVMEPAGECVCGGEVAKTPPPLPGAVTI
jgi:hypothetical protein